MIDRRAPRALALALGLASAPAAASPAYSTLLAQRLGITTEPGCGVCHAADPSVDHVTLAPFGQALRTRGFTDSSNLVTAFDQMATEKIDSDGDQAIDTDELSWGGDPNSPNGLQGEPAPELRQGFCDIGPAPGAATPAGMATAVALGLAVLARRRSKKNAR